MTNGNFCPVCTQVIYDPLLTEIKKELDAYYQLRSKLNECKDQLHRRNCLIKKLRVELKQAIEENTRLIKANIEFNNR
jgi:hypothetical protein